MFTIRCIYLCGLRCCRRSRRIPDAPNPAREAFLFGVHSCEEMQDEQGFIGTCCSIPSPTVRVEARLTDGSALRSDNSPQLEGINCLLTGIFNAASICLAVFDSQARVVMSNPAFACRIANSSVSACLGKTVRELLGHQAADLEVAIKQVWKIRQGEPGIQVLTEGSNTNQAQYWLFNLVSVKDQADGSTRVAAIAVETSHQKRVEQYLLTLMADMSWIRERISKDPSSLNKHGEIPRSTEKTGLLDLVSEEVRSFSAMLGDGARIPPRGSVTTGSRLEHPSHQRLPQQETEELASLSPRELQVLTLAGNGKSNKEIAELAGLSIKTVETYRNRLGLKLDLHSTIEIVLYAVRNHLISQAP
jgi:DNA-binding CsgD family transcriptional regulator